MLSKQDTELLCRVGPGTPMGAFLREFWIPLLLSSESLSKGETVTVAWFDRLTTNGDK